MQEISTTIRAYRQSIIQGLFIGLGAGAVFVAGFLFRGVVNGPTPVTAAGQVIETTNGFALLDEVQSLIDSHYLREQPSAQQREYAAIRGLLGSLNDRYTFFIDPPVAQSESDVLAGTYGGIGVQVRRAEDGSLVMYPFADSPAQRAGIQDGDVLVAINGQAVDISMSQDVIDQMLRGEVKEENGVELAYKESATENPKTVFILFDVINVPSVVWRTLSETPDIGYVQILMFTARTPEEMQSAISDLRNDNIRALVLDLRNNSGGLLQEAVDVAAQFLQPGVIVYERTHLDERSLDSDITGVAADLPLVVLVNQGTASAAELVAGAIRDRNRGQLIGQVTYGKGSVQQIFRLSDDSSLHITAAEWLTPAQKQLDGVGLDPDIVMIPDANGRDVELGEAVRQLNQILQQQGS
jgi:carboxyl-terminal processing protease